MNTPSKNIALLCNPTIEKAIKLADAIASILQTGDISFAVFTTYWPTVWENFTEAWIIGGDGTMNFFINAYPGFQLPLALFAAGSGNDLHWMLYGDTNVSAQVQTVLNAPARAIDAGTCNGKFFINGVGIGFDGEVVKSMQGKKKLAGKASYLLSIMKNIFLYKEKNCTIKYGGTVVTQECLMISVANARRYGGGFHVAPKASLTDSLLDIVTVGKIDASRRMRYLPVIEKGEHLNLPFVSYGQSGRVFIQSNVALAAHLDGEYFSANTFEIQCLVKRFTFLY